MACPGKCLLRAKTDDKSPVGASRLSQLRRANHLKDEVYREMLLLEVNRPGAELGLAVALLRAIVQSEPLTDQEEYRGWLKAICGVGLRMIEAALGEGRRYELK